MKGPDSEQNNPQQDIAAQDAFAWDLLPKDLKIFILKRSNLSTVFSLRNVSRRNRTIVEFFLKTVSASDLLRLLPMWADDRSDREFSTRKDTTLAFECAGYRSARLEVLKFQQLARLLNLGSRWKKFNTLEAGVLALMTVPLNQLDAQDIVRLTQGNMPSEFLNTEKARLDQLHGAGRVDSITNIARKAFEEVYDFTKVESVQGHVEKALAIMILRTTKDHDIQNLLVDVACNVKEETQLVRSLLNLYFHATRTNNKRLLEISEWLTGAKGVGVKDKLEKLEARVMHSSKEIYKLKRRWYSLLTHPNCCDHPMPLNEMSDGCFRNLLSAIGSYNLWCFALIFDSWQQAIDLSHTIVIHRKQILKDSPMSVFLKARLTGPSFGNYSGIGLKELVLFKFHLCDDLYGATLLNVEEITECTYDNCIMDYVQLSKGRCRESHFSNMAIKKLLSEHSTFERCEFTQIKLSDSEFNGSTFIGALFRDCYFSSSVSFNGCRFEGFGHGPDQIGSSLPCPTCGPILFERCEFDAQSLINVVSIDNCWLINCTVHNSDKLPNKFRCYQTKNKDIESVEYAYELFCLFEKSKDQLGIAYLINTLYINIGHTLKSAAERGIPVSRITVEEDAMYRKIFSYEFSTINWLLNIAGKGAKPNALERYESLMSNVQLIDKPLTNS